MVIEWLRIPVPRDMHEVYLARDAVIWTPVLAAQPGFAGKESWRDAGDPDTLHLVIRWHSLAQWQAVPRALLDATDAAFAVALGTTYAVAACLTYEVLTVAARAPA